MTVELAIGPALQFWLEEWEDLEAIRFVEERPKDVTTAEWERLDRVLVAAGNNAVKLLVSLMDRDVAQVFAASNYVLEPLKVDRTLNEFWWCISRIRRKRARAELARIAVALTIDEKHKTPIVLLSFWFVRDGKRRAQRLLATNASTLEKARFISDVLDRLTLGPWLVELARWPVGDADSLDALREPLQSATRAFANALSAFAEDDE